MAGRITARTVGVLTNRVPTDPYRGAGRPEATHHIERMVDLVAQEIGMDPAEIRRKNFIKEFPFTNNFGLVYDSGNYEGRMDRALANVGYGAAQAAGGERATRPVPRHRVRTWIEICGFGPSAATAPAARPGAGRVGAGAHASRPAP